MKTSDPTEFLHAYLKLGARNLVGALKKIARFTRDKTLAPHPTQNLVSAPGAPASNNLGISLLSFGLGTKLRALAAFVPPDSSGFVPRRQEEKDIGHRINDCGLNRDRITFGHCPGNNL